VFATNRKRKEKSEQDTIQLTNLFLRRNVQRETVSVGCDKRVSHVEI
jgi:hypothetical protein